MKTKKKPAEKKRTAAFNHVPTKKFPTVKSVRDAIEKEASK